MPVAGGVCLAEASGASLQRFATAPRELAALQRCGSQQNSALGARAETAEVPISTRRADHFVQLDV